MIEHVVDRLEEALSPGFKVLVVEGAIVALRSEGATVGGTMVLKAEECDADAVSDLVTPVLIRLGLLTTAEYGHYAAVWWPD